MTRTQVRKGLFVFIAVVLAAIAHAGGDDQEKLTDAQRFLTFPFAGAVSWDIHDGNGISKVVDVFGQPNSRSNEFFQGSALTRTEIITFEYSGLTFKFIGAEEYQARMLQSIEVKTDRVPLAFGIQLGSPKLVLQKILGSAEDIVVLDLAHETIISYASHATYVVDGVNWDSIISCKLTVTFDDRNLIDGLKWHYGTGH